MGVVITFYSYKGGVGRSMAMANLGALMMSWGKKVLLIDWDLEAPGLENYFKDYIKVDTSKREGLINLLARKNENTSYSVSDVDWDKMLVNIDVPIDKKLFPNARLDLLTAGLRDNTYIQHVRALDYDKFYEENEGGNFLEGLRDHWISQYDFVLIDSRTGLTDSSGVCSIQMPDILVMLFTATEQGFKGTLEVARRAVSAQEKLIYDRFKLKLLPVPTRFDSTEFKLQQDWLGRFTDGLKEVYSTWVPDYPKDEDININHRDLLELTKLPYIPYFSYGEKLPVIEHGTKDPQGLGYAYETIAAMLCHKLEGAKMLVESRGEFVKRAKESRLPYEDESDLVTKDQVAVPDQGNSKIKQIGLAVVLFAIVVFFVWQIRKSFSVNDTEVRNDSLVYALKASEFVNSYKIADTSNVADITNLKISLFEKGLQHDTSLVIRNIRKSISRILKNEIQFDLPILYQDLAQGKFEPRNHYADTIRQFVTLRNITLSSLDSMSGFFKVKGYNNTIENDSILSFSYDSMGYMVRYVEVGNFIPSATSYTKSEQRIRVPVTVNLNDQLKITGLIYGDVEKIPLTTVKSKIRIRVDIFAVSTNSSVQLYLMESIYNELQSTSKFLPRKRMLKNETNDRDGYSVTQSEIRYNYGEEKYAWEIQQIILKSTGQKFSLRPVSSITEDYLSIFIVDRKNSMMK